MLTGSEVFNIWVNIQSQPPNFLSSFLCSYGFKKSRETKKSGGYQRFLFSTFSKGPPYDLIFEQKGVPFEKVWNKNLRWPPLFLHSLDFLDPYEHKKLDKKFGGWLQSILMLK